MPEYTIIFDGGCLGNPGKAYGSFKLQTREGKERIMRLQFGHGTNNSAEYMALNAALKDLRDAIIKTGKNPANFDVEVLGDSQLVIQQVRGVWKCKNTTLKPLLEEARALAGQFKQVTFAWHPRSVSEAHLGH